MLTPSTARSIGLLFRRLAFPASVSPRQCSNTLRFECTASHSTCSMRTAGGSGSTTRWTMKCRSLWRGVTAVHLLSSRFFGLSGFLPGAGGTGRLPTRVMLPSCPGDLARAPWGHAPWQRQPCTRRPRHAQGSGQAAQDARLSPPALASLSASGPRSARDQSPIINAPSAVKSQAAQRATFAQSPDVFCAFLAEAPSSS